MLHPWNAGNWDHLMTVDLRFMVRIVTIQYLLYLGTVAAMTMMPFFQIIPQGFEVATGDLQL
jgi:hypothetical protein